MNKAGRAKGTRVTQCDKCARRVAGVPGKYVTCPGCGKSIHVSLKAKARKIKRVFIKGTKKR